jgi:putative transcriptional regulator
MSIILLLSSHCDYLREVIKLYIKLKKLREQFGYTQQEMANKLGYNSKSTYNQKEKGIRKITVEEAHEISKIFNKTIEEIFFKSEVVKTTTKLKETG